MLARLPEDTNRPVMLRMHMLLGVLGTAVAGLILAANVRTVSWVTFTPGDRLHWDFVWGFLSFGVVAPFVLAAPGICLRNVRVTIRGMLAGVLLGLVFALTSVPEFVSGDYVERRLLVRIAGLFVFAPAISALSVYLVTQDSNASYRAAVRAPLLALTAMVFYTFSQVFSKEWFPMSDVYLPMQISVRIVVEGLIFSVLPLAVALDWIPLSQRVARWIWWALNVPLAISLVLLFIPRPEFVSPYLLLFELALLPTFIYWFWSRLNWAQRVVPLLPTLLLLSAITISAWMAP